MNWLDITILILIGLGLIKGLFDGMIKQVASLAALIVGIYLCSGVAGWLQGLIPQSDKFPPQAVVMTSYIIGFVLIVGLVLSVGAIVNRMVNATPLGIFNHVIGGALGLILMILFISLVFNVLEQMDTKSVWLSQEIKVESRFYFLIKSIVADFLPGNLFTVKEWMSNV